jgi:tetrahydromethanopterin S-methyltransferase subunit C
VPRQLELDWWTIEAVHAHLHSVVVASVVCALVTVLVRAAHDIYSAVMRRCLVEFESKMTLCFSEMYGVWPG